METLQVRRLPIRVAAHVFDFSLSEEHRSVNIITHEKGSQERYMFT
jgi:hypothetical protein